MPELPEVETVKRGLDKLIVTKQIAEVDFDWVKSFPNSQADVNQFMIGAMITNVRRRAKVLIIDLSTNYSLIVHLKMTGQLVFVEKSTNKVRNNKLEIRDKLEITNSKKANLDFHTSELELTESDSVRFGAGHPNDSLVGELPDKSTRVQIVFKDGSHLYFNDQRKFGWMRLLPTDHIAELDFFKKVGPEPLSADFTSQVFVDRVRRRAGTTIKAAILDQTVLAGVGNIYADESLWGAKINPAEKVRDVSDKRLKTLHREIVYVLQLSIGKGGSTNKNYVNAEGKKGSYMDFARVFRRETLPCPRCNTIIEKTRVAGRGTHFCPHCQKV